MKIVCPSSLNDLSPLHACHAQELVTANSSLKATLQQRDNALEQRHHELACCESMLQEVHERLAASEAAAADAAAQHCEAMWAKGQVAGLMEVNEALQVQLEQQAQELEQLKAAVERCAGRAGNSALLNLQTWPSAVARSSFR
jgi:predicted RNase H-like nuclease (RuvC/YqgF family)